MGDLSDRLGPHQGAVLSGHLPSGLILPFQARETDLQTVPPAPMTRHWLCRRCWRAEHDTEAERDQHETECREGEGTTGAFSKEQEDEIARLRAEHKSAPEIAQALGLRVKQVAGRLSALTRAERGTLRLGDDRERVECAVGDWAGQRRYLAAHEEREHATQEQEAPEIHQAAEARPGWTCVNCREAATVTDIDAHMAAHHNHVGTAEGLAQTLRKRADELEREARTVDSAAYEEAPNAKVAPCVCGGAPDLRAACQALGCPGFPSRPAFDGVTMPTLVTMADQPMHTLRFCDLIDGDHAYETARNVVAGLLPTRRYRLTITAEEVRADG